MKDAKDPDELIKKFGAEAYKHALDSSLSGVEYDLENVYPEGGFSDEEEKIEYIKNASDILKHIKSDIELEVYANKVALQTGLPKEKVMAFINDKKRSLRQFEKRDFENNIAVIKKTPEETLIKIIVENFSYFSKIKDKISEEDFSDELLKKIFQNFKRLIENGVKPDVSMVLEGLNSEEMKRAGKLFIDKEPFSDFLKLFLDLKEKINKEKDTVCESLEDLNERIKQMKTKFKKDK